MIIAVDFDGTIAERNYPGVGAFLPHAKATLLALQAQGHDLVLWTCREKDALEAAVNFLISEGLVFKSINQNSPAFTGEAAFRKIYADFYIDDRIVGGFPGWEKIAEFFNISLDGLS